MNDSPSTSLPAQSRMPRADHFPPGWRWLGRALIAHLCDRNRRAALAAERERLPPLESAIATIKRELLRARELGLSNVERLHNVGLYILLMDRDFAVLKVEMVSTFEDWKLAFTARQMAVLIYEACDDLTTLLGKDFRRALEALGLAAESMEQLNKISKRLNQFKNVNRGFLYDEVRNLTAAHRVKDSIQFMEALDKLDPMKVFQLGGEFFGIVEDLVGFLVETTKLMGRLDVALKQLLDSSKFS
jgi:hypothetical protein